jgi:6-pyruvoyltetrahydropterin/6-carboxytetrahydropterin synthase
MYEVTVRQHFDAAHYLRNYGGRCENLHGHRYEVTVTVVSDQLNDIGLAFDFTELKARMQALLKRYDHHCLNDLADFATINPSAENIARTFYDHLTIAVPEARISHVTVWESPDSWATYRPD